MNRTMISGNRKIYFKNRAHAGTELAALLEPKYKHLNPLVLGVPRGGVEVAYYVAKQLHAELALVVAKKLPYPGQPEFGFGAVAEDYSVYVSPKYERKLSPKAINQLIEEQIDEIKRRVEKYRKGKPLPDMKGRIVIIVDDGIATGVTLVPIIKLCKKRGAGKIVVASPVSDKVLNPALYEADSIEIVVQPDAFRAVGQVYQNFGEFTDEQLLELLQHVDWNIKRDE